MSKTATWHQVRGLIESLPIFDMSEQPVQQWIKRYPILMPDGQVWQSVAEQIAVFATENAITFFEMPKIRLEKVQDDKTGEITIEKFVYAEFKARRFIKADLKFRNQKTAAELATTPAKWTA